VIVRLPVRLVDPDVAQCYCSDDAVSVWTADHHVVVAAVSDEEGDVEWGGAEGGVRRAARPRGAVTLPSSGALEAEVAALRAENVRLRRLLDLTPEQARLPAAAQTGLFLDRPGPVTGSSSGPDKVRFFRALFAARTDVYAVR
jgi:hypothetical protein